MADTNLTRMAYGKLFMYVNQGHKYIFDGVERKGRSVTTILNRVLAKQGLALWPLDVAMKLLASRLPSISQKDLEEAAGEHIKLRNKGGDTGTVTHGLIAQILTGSEHALDARPTPEVTLALSAFANWRDVMNPKVLASEQMVASLRGNYYGTFDGIFEINGRLVMVDFKTTNTSREAPDGIYAKDFIQLGGYLAAYTEESAEHAYDIDLLMIVSIQKNGKWAVKTNEDLNLSIYDCMNLWNSTLLLDSRLGDMNKILNKEKTNAQDS